MHDSPPRRLARPGALVSLLVPLAVAPLAAQPASAPERFAPLSWLVGEWQGYGLFSDDTTYIHKRFRYELEGMFLVEETLDIFPPAEPTTDYQVHQDRLFYYPRGAGFAAKGFFVEGFVWNAGVSVSGDTIRITTEEVEGGPPGFAARITLIRETADGYRATFELGTGDGDFRIIERLFMRRTSGG